MLLTTQKKKTLLFLVMFLIAGAAASNIRLLTEKDPFCNEYDAEGCCCKCAFRFYFNKDTKLCTQVSDFCATWDNKTGACLSCYPSYGSPVKGVCSSTPVTGNTDNCECDCNCQAFNNHRECVKCYKDYEFNAHKKCVACVTEAPVVVERPVHKPVYKPVQKPIVTSYCLKYAYADVKGKHYSKWFDGCKQICLECVSGYYLQKGICILLPKYCEAVDSKGRCVECCDGYEVSQGKCVPIVTTPEDEDNCAKYGYVDAKGKWFNKWAVGCEKVCKECVDGYYLTADFECVALPRYCTDADTDGMCTACETGYEVSKTGKCVKIVVTLPSVDNCAEYVYVDVKGKIYSKWIYGCKKVCKVCKHGYELVDGKCVPCEEEVSVENDNPFCVERNADGDCCKCAFRTYLNKAGICTPVSDYCETWNKKTGACTCCYDGYLLVKGDCVLAMH